MAVERIPIVDRTSWLEQRAPFINASEVATVCGLGPFGSLAELYATKKGLRPPRQDTALLQRGRWLEYAVFEALAEQRPDWHAKRAAIYLLDRERRLGCTPDGFAYDTDRGSVDDVMPRGRGVIQAKVISRTVFRRRWLLDEADRIEDGEAEPPIYYVLQTLTEMALSECSWGALAVLVTGEFDAVLRIFELERDDNREALVFESVRQFWHDHLDPGIMPAFDPQRDEALIRALYPKSDGALIDLSTDNRALAAVEEMTESQVALTRLSKTVSALKAELTAKLGANSYGLLNDGRCLSFKSQHRKAYSVAAADYRVLRVLKKMPQLSNENDDEEE